MAKVTTISMRIAPNIKAQAEQLFFKMGLSLTDAIRAFLQVSISSGELPFPLSEPFYKKGYRRFMRRAEIHKQNWQISISGGVWEDIPESKLDAYRFNGTYREVCHELLRCIRERRSKENPQENPWISGTTKMKEVDRGIQFSILYALVYAEFKHGHICSMSGVSIEDVV